MYFLSHPGVRGEALGKDIIIREFTPQSQLPKEQNRCTSCICYFFMFLSRSRFKVIVMLRDWKLNQLNELFEEFGLTELVLRRDEIEELLHVLHEAKKQLISENHYSVVIAFTADESANSHVYPDLQCHRLKVLVGWETTSRESDYSTVYAVDELEKELIDFNNRIRLI